MKIDIPQVLLDLRSDVKKAETREKQNRLEKFAYRMFAWLMTHPRVYAMAGRIGRRAADSEDRAGARVDQPARSSAHAEEKLPRYLEPPLMSREHILHRVRTALGRSEGQPPAAAPAVRLRVPDVDRETRIASMLERVEALAGKTYRAANPEDACGFAAGLIAGKTAIASNAPFLAECGIARSAGRAQRHHGPRGTARIVRHVRSRHHQRRLRAGGYRYAGHAFEPARSAHDLAAAARAYGDSAGAIASSAAWMSCLQSCRIQRN